MTVHNEFMIPGGFAAWTVQARARFLANEIERNDECAGNRRLSQTLREIATELDLHQNGTAECFTGDVPHA